VQLTEEKKRGKREKRKERGPSFRPKRDRKKKGGCRGGSQETGVQKSDLIQKNGAIQPGRGRERKKSNPKSKRRRRKKGKKNQNKERVHEKKREEGRKEKNEEEEKKRERKEIADTQGSP